MLLIGRYSLQEVGHLYQVLQMSQGLLQAIVTLKWRHNSLFIGLYQMLHFFW